MSRGQEAGLPLGYLHDSFFLGPGLDGWAAANKLGSHGAPFMGRCQEAGLLLGSLHISFWRSWVGCMVRNQVLGLLGRVGRGQEIGLALGSFQSFRAPGQMGGPRPKAGLLPDSFLGCWFGWVDHGQGARRPSYFFSGLLGPFVFPPRMDGPRAQGWAPMTSLRSRLLRSLSSLHVSFSDSWNGWVVHGIFIALYADKSLPKYARLNSCSRTTAIRCVYQALL